jgi:hypothetical protein
VDYFLFDLRQGYCDYFASSMVVMLRTLGIPARYVLGYASGAFDASRQEYRVLELNYHAWVEAYFPGYGWIPFEPTPATSIAFGGPGNNPISTPNVTRELSGILGLLDDEEEDDEGFIGFFPDFDGDLALATTPMLIAAIVAVAAGLLALAWYRVWWRLGRLERADELYAKLLRLASALGVARRVGQTPHEYAEMLAGQLPEHAADIRTIAATYAHRRYAAGAVSLTEVRHAEEAWGRLRWPLIRRLFGPRQTKPTPATAT